ncbi:hypothetical protein JB92DRAFT_3107174 [Gautieria morchelliformis]|nr:hypothetical protein JB92DRAFT_3107174 [Gautieria morchelliformis]
MSIIPDALSQLLEETSGNPALLEVLLDVAATRAAKLKAEAISIPPPQVMVRWRSHEVVFARSALQSSSLLVVYGAFTRAFELEQRTGNTSLESEWDPMTKTKVSYIPMKLYATFLWGPGAEKKTDHEVSGGDGSWGSLLNNIDEIHILTMAQHYARREKEEKLFEARGELGASTTTS